MRTEAEIRAALERLSRPQKRELQVVAGATAVPLNKFTTDLLRWVLSEPSTFGKALDELAAREQARRN